MRYEGGDYDSDVLRKMTKTSIYPASEPRVEFEARMRFSVTILQLKKLQCRMRWERDHEWCVVRICKEMAVLSWHSLETSVKVARKPTII